MYGESDWVKYRRKFIYHNPKCYVCARRAKVVDHIIPHKGNRELFENTKNHLPMCESCHNTVTTMFDRNYKVGDPVDAKAEWIEKRRRYLNNQTKVRIMTKYK